MGGKARKAATEISSRLVPRKMLSSDERVVFESRPSRWFHMKLAWLALLLAAVLFAMVALNVVPKAPHVPYLSSTVAGALGAVLEWTYLIAAILATSFFLVRRRGWTNITYAATDERIIKITRKGLMTKIYEDIPLTQIEDVRMSQSPWEKYTGCGTFAFSTQGLDKSGDTRSDRGVQMCWEEVPRPLDIRSKLQDVMDIRAKPDRSRKH